MIQLIVLWGARQAVGEPALDGIRNLPRWAHLRRVPDLADRVIDGCLGHVGVNGAGDGRALMVLSRGRYWEQTDAEEGDDRPT